MRVTSLQIEIRDGECDVNLACGLAALQAAPASDAYLLPEMFTTGYAFSSWEKAADENTPRTIEQLREFAAAHKAVVLAGAIARNQQGKLVNRLWWLSASGVRHYDKIHLIAAFREPELLARGHESLIADINGVQAHASTCFDLRFPELYRAAALDGAEMFLIIAEWPALRSEALFTLARARAMENQAYVALCNRVGKANDGMTFSGGSIIFDPEGNVMAQAGDRPGFCSALVDVERVRKLRRDFPVLQMSVLFEHGKASVGAENYQAAPARHSR